MDERISKKCKELPLLAFVAKTLSRMTEVTELTNGGEEGTVDDATDFWTICCLVERVDFDLELGRDSIAEPEMFQVMVVVGIDVIAYFGAGTDTVSYARNDWRLGNPIH